MIVAIHQPHYLPWLRYVDKISRSDVFVLLDDAQYTKNGWQNRNKVKCAQGWMYLTVPVRDAFGKPINAVQIHNDMRWRAKHWGALRTNYARAPYFGRYRERFEEVYRRDWAMLCDLAAGMLTLVLDALGVGTSIVRSSELGIPGDGAARLVEICRALGADTYLSGDYAAANHLESARFRECGIHVQRQGWRCSAYRQQHQAAGFIPDLSVVDLLFNEGVHGLALLQRCHKEVFVG